MSNPSAPPPPPSTVGVDALGEMAIALQKVEELAENKSGVVVLRIGDIPDTAIIVQNGNICWATSRAMEGRFSHLLTHYFGTVGSSLPERVLAALRHQEGTPEQALRECGIDEQSLRRTLCQHIVETLVSVPIDCLPNWTTHTQGTFGARHAFSGSELLSKGAEWLLSKEAKEANGELRKATRGETTGLSFERVRGGELLLLAAVHAGSVTVRDAFDVGRCAIEILDLSSSFCPSERVTCSTTSFGMDIVTWATETRIYCLYCTDQALLAAKLVSVAKLLKLADPPADTRPSGTQPIGR